MKSFILIVALINFVSAGENFDPSKVPGCEKVKDIKGTSLKTCCETYPNLHDPDVMKECSSTCASAGSSHIEKKCCWTKCAMTAKKLIKDNGELDTEALNNYIMEKLEKSEAWTEPVKKSIDDCVKEAPDMLAKWKEKEPTVEKCDFALNMVMKHCVLRNLFFNCPSKTSSDKCTELEEFGKSCSLFPQVGGFAFKKQKKQKKKESDGDDEE
ncbi:hypothetical protein PVAND_009737 [Polypedilum vanderplanki]|uniref:OBP47-like domain-containing protein n=1 Tax=Polypedilum vanderplanki TaxID=319348 RepID=A0A9J6CDN6_POLVA|nr:hypothetical protein PVAND_009737 [Polypedilum vanderplanki]